MFTSTLVYAGLLPMATAAMTALLAARSRLSPPAVWASGTVAGVVVGLLGLKSRAGISVTLRALTQPSESADWIPLIVLLAWGITMMWLAVPTSRQRYVLVIAALFLLAVPLQLLSKNVRLTRDWPTSSKLVCLAVLAAALGVTWRLLATRGDDGHSPVKLPLIVATVIASALVLTFSAHAFVYGEACGTLAAALTGTALARILALPLASSPLLPLPPGEGRGEGSPATGSASVRHRHQLNGLSGTAGPITLTLCSYLILGRFFADLSTLNAVLLLASLIAAGGPLPRPLAQSHGWQPLALRFAACLIPLSLALASALI